MIVASPSPVSTLQFGLGVVTEEMVTREEWQAAAIALQFGLGVVTEEIQMSSNRTGKSWFGFNSASVSSPRRSP